MMDHASLIERLDEAPQMADNIDDDETAGSGPLTLAIDLTSDDLPGDDLVSPEVVAAS